MKQDYPDIITTILQLQGVSQVTMTQDKEYLLTVINGQNKTSIEMELLVLLQQNNWFYAQLNNGKTLENQLF